MYKFSIEIEAVSPLRMNPLTKEAQADIRSPKPSSKKTDAELMEIAKKKIQRDKAGNICIEAKALKAVGRNGGSRVKVSKRFLGRDFKAAVYFDDWHIPVLDNKGKQFKEPSGYHFEFVKRPPKTGTPVPEMWPFFEDWRIKATGYITDDRIDIQSIKQAYIEGGMSFGLLDGRPDWGRFIVKKCEKID